MKLLFAILCPKPEIRATIQEIEANPWVNQPVDINNYKWEEVIRNTEFNGNNAGECNQLEEEFNPKFVVKPVNEKQDKMDHQMNDENSGDQVAQDSLNKNSETNKCNLVVSASALLSRSF
jgi:hypothetical protein